MACLNTLKQEIKTLESVFPKSHERFQIMSASVDELSCRFVGKNGKKYEIHANITVSVPSMDTICDVGTGFGIIVGILVSPRPPCAVSLLSATDRGQRNNNTRVVIWRGLLTRAMPGYTVSCTVILGTRICLSCSFLVAPCVLL